MLHNVFQNESPIYSFSDIVFILNSVGGDDTVNDVLTVPSKLIFGSGS